MSQVRVFELAKELNMPAKQLLTKIRKAGIPATGNFFELSMNQANLVRKIANNEKEIILPKSSKKTISINKNLNQEKKVPTIEEKIKIDENESKVVTISTKSQLDSNNNDEIPKRRVRRKKNKIESSFTSEEYKEYEIKSNEKDRTQTSIKEKKKTI